MAGIAFGHAAGIAFGPAAEYGYACAFVLAIVFVQAAVAKAVRPTDTTAGFLALGVPGAPAMARIVPLVEVGVAFGLLSVPRIGGVAALVTLAGFSAFVGRAISAGVRSGCNCFGQRKGDPVSAVDLVRNALLAALAVGALLAARPVAFTTTSTVAAIVVSAAGATLLWSMRRRKRPFLSPSTTPDVAERDTYEGGRG